MTDIATHIATAKAEFAKHRVNKAVLALISAVELLSGVEAPAEAEPTKTVLTEPAPAPEAAPLVEKPAEEVTPEALSRILATADLEASQEPVKQAPKKKPAAGTRSSDV